MAARVGVAALVILVVALGACDGPQSALATASRDAETVARLWWWMAGGALVIWAAVVGIGWYAIRVEPERHGERAASLLIVGAGVALPAVVLGGLLLYALGAMPGLLALPADGVRVEVSGEQWWWRVRYQLPDGSSFELANEIYLPVGRRTEVVLVSPDVIHSFWIPSLAGKMDMIPGRTTRLALEPARTGVFRGVCAEYCGESHALMSLYAVVVDEPEFEAWLQWQAAPAREPSGAAPQRGRDLFMANGCAACHTVRGTGAAGVIGPDLTHVGSRMSLAAGILPNDPETMARWIARPDSIKPGVHMPGFWMLPEGQVPALAAYLSGLE